MLHALGTQFVCSCYAGQCGIQVHCAHGSLKKLQQFDRKCKIHTRRKRKSIKMRTTCEQNANNSPHYACVTQNARTRNAYNMRNMCPECFHMHAGSILQCLQGACKTHATSVQRQIIPIAYAMRTQCVQHAYNTRSSTYGAHTKRRQHAGTCATHVNPTD